MLIAITTGTNDGETAITLNRPYWESLQAFGAVPVVLPMISDADMLDEIISRFDGFVLSGGGDIDPALFAEDTLPACGSISPERDEMEILLAQKLYRAAKPTLGICRGMQVMNVALGGTLYQDIPSQRPDSIAHRQKQPSRYPAHAVHLENGTKLRGLIRESCIRVNSLHHQAVKKISSKLIIAAMSTDGLIEAIEAPDHPFYIGVQWHPERLWQGKDASASTLFRAFVRAVHDASSHSTR